MGTLYLLLTAIISELVFVIGFILIYAIVRLLHFPYSLLHVKNKYRWMSDGILSGSLIVLLVCYVAFKMPNPNNYSEFVIILTALLLPLIGEIGYYRYFAHKKSTLFIGRLHLAMKTFVQRGEYAVHFHALSEEKIRNDEHGDLRNEESLRELGKEAYDQTQGYLAYLFLWCFLGYAIGVVIFHYKFYK